jgi:hypothetical protein
MTPEYASLYRTYDLGIVPGIPATSHIGGCVLKFDDPNTLLLAVNAEAPNGAIRAVHLKRDDCGHIVGFEPVTEAVAETPYIDANLIYGPNRVLFYSMWPEMKVGQLLPDASAPVRISDLAALGMPGQDAGDRGPGGIGFVPPSIAGAVGELRAVTWPQGHWNKISYAPDGAQFSLNAVSRIVKLENGPGGFAYIPAGSPGFPKQSIIVSEWSADQVASYEVDAQGDPIVSTRTTVFSAFPKPWGAYFDPVSGDYLFLTWKGPPDRIFSVQGFAPPPPVPR